MTCLCLTHNRRQWLPKAIECFQAQTYQHRELLILADGEDVRDLVPDDRRIRLVHLEGISRIGTKRNVGIRKAEGEIIAHWDDDDFSAPDRLVDQISRLLEKSGQSVTGYSSMRFTDGAAWWLYKGLPHYALGTSLCYWRQWALDHPFKDKQIGEDNDFVEAAHRAGQLVTVPAGELMHAAIHPGNTSPKSRDGRINWERL